MYDKLLTREEFKRLVFLRTKGRCCVPGCMGPAADAHHIMDRKLWSDGGYYLSNGAALCSSHHLEAEKGILTPADCTRYMDISFDIIRKPDSLDCPEEEYRELFASGKMDKWGAVKEDRGYDERWFLKFEKKKK